MLSVADCPQNRTGRQSTSSRGSSSRSYQLAQSAYFRRPGLENYSRPSEDREALEEQLRLADEAEQAEEKRVRDAVKEETRQRHAREDAELYAELRRRNWRIGPKSAGLYMPKNPARWPGACCGEE